MAKTIRTTTALVTSLLMAFLLTSCGDSHEKVADDTIKQFDKFIDIMMSVEDKDSAEKAKGKIDKLIPKFEKLADRYEKLGTPDEDTVKKLREKMKAYGEKVDKKMEGKQKDLGADGMAAMMTMMESMQKLEKTFKRMPALEPN